MEEISKPILIKKEEEENNNNENENIEAPPSVIQSHIGIQPQSFNDNHITNINCEISDLNNIASDNQNMKIKLRSNPYKKDNFGLNYDNNNLKQQGHISQLEDAIKTPEFMNNNNFEDQNNNNPNIINKFNNNNNYFTKNLVNENNNIYIYN